MFLDRIVNSFVADCLAGLKGNQDYLARNSVDRLYQALGHRPRIDELTTGNILKVLRRLARNGYTSPSIKRYRTILVRLARYCWRRGFLANMPDTPPLPTAPMQHVRKPLASKGTLAHLFATKLVHQHLPVASPKQLNDFHAAIAQFSRFLRYDATLADITEQNLEQFVDAQVAAGRKLRDANDKRYKLWRVARMADEQQFPDRRFNEALPPLQAGTLREFFESNYYPLRLVGKSKNRYAEFMGEFRKLNRYAGHEVRLDELTDSFYAGFMSSQIEAGLKPVSVNGTRARIFAVWRLAADLGRIEKYPRVKKLTESLDAPDAWSEEELRRIIAAPLRIDWGHAIAGVPTGQWMHALLLVVYWTALRRGTLLKLRRVDVNLVSGWVNVPGSIMKSGRGKRMRLGPDAIAALREIWLPERVLLFPFPHDGTTLSKYFRRVLAAAEIPASDRPGLNQLHKMRRSVATITAVRKGLAAASELLGHSGVEVTRRYIDPSKMPGSDFTEVLPMLTGPAAAIAEPPSSTADADRSDWTPADFAGEALELAEAGDLLRAALPARIALERWLVALCPRRPEGTLPDTGSRLRWLVEHNKLTAEQAAQYRRAKKIASRAVHRGYIKPPQFDVLLAAVRELVAPPSNAAVST